MSSVHDFKAKALSGEDVSLADFRGKVLLIVNTASKCGFTSQYAGLEKLYEELAPRGFAVLGFPCNQFGQQEPGDAQEIARFCSLSYNVTFPMFAKIDVNGPSAHPLYEFLKSEKSGLLGIEAIKWNFSKFLVDKEGRVVERYAPMTTPAALKGDVEALLGN
jgi:glutathione peroxidase